MINTQMSMKPSRVPSHFHITFRPIPDPAAVVLGSHVRFTVLTSRLIRLESSTQDRFEDGPSQVFWYRQQPVPEFEIRRSAVQLEIITEHLHLAYTIGPKGFRRETLSIELRQSGRVWHFGDRDIGNLHGTARTLDGADGRVRLGPGLISRSGWAVVDDSVSLVFDQDGWLEPRAAPDNLDLYFFGYGHDYLGCLQDFCRVAGSTPLIPRWALGNWWSRYWEYSQAELVHLMQEFQTHGVPLSVCIIDMDWHITQTGNASSGWTGYT
jgi:alpha-glucosidase (family GH31 glycosyl hydrolase)